MTTPFHPHAVPVICLTVLAILTVAAIRHCRPTHHRQSIRYRNPKAQHNE